MKPTPIIPLIAIPFLVVSLTAAVFEVQNTLDTGTGSLRQAILDAGGSISHHHGVGKLRKDFLPRVFSPTSVGTMREIKQQLDPQNIFGIRNNVLAE